jgi:hypothetical protein
MCDHVTQIIDAEEKVIADKDEASEAAIAARNAARRESKKS